MALDPRTKPHFFHSAFIRLSSPTSLPKMSKQQQAVLARQVSKALGNDGVEIEITFEKKGNKSHRTVTGTSTRAGTAVAKPGKSLPTVETKVEAKVEDKTTQVVKVDETDDAALSKYLCRSPWRKCGVIMIKIEGLSHSMAVHSWQELEDAMERGRRKARTMLDEEREVRDDFSEPRYLEEPRIIWFDATGLTIDPIGTLNYSGRANFQKKLQTGQWFTSPDTLIADIDSVWNCPDCAQEEREYKCRLHAERPIIVDSSRFYSNQSDRSRVRSDYGSRSRSRSRSPIDGQPSRRLSPTRSNRERRQSPVQINRRRPSPPRADDRYVPTSPPRQLPTPSKPKPVVPSAKQVSVLQFIGSLNPSSSYYAETHKYDHNVMLDRVAVSSGALGRLASTYSDDKD